MIARRAAWLTAGGCFLVLAALAAWLVPWHWGPRVPVSAASVFSPEEIARATAYRSRVHAWSWSSLAVSVVVAIGLGLTPIGPRLVGRLPRRLRWAWAVLGWQLLTWAVALPFGWGIRRAQLDAGLTHQSAAGWWQDQATSFGTGLVAVLAGIGALVLLARRTPRWWFAWGAAGAAAMTVALSFAYPLVVEPLYNRFTSLPDGPLRTSVLELAAREHVRVDDVLVADASRRTTTLNAYVTGLGSSRRVVLYDTTVASLPQDEVESVVAHELGHVAHHDVLLGTGLGALGAAGGVAVLALVLDTTWVRRRAGGAGDARSVPAVLALVMLASLAAAPAVSVVSRAIEARADQAALTATRDPEAFEEMQRTLAVRALADPTPPRWAQVWFGDHPTTLERIGLARAWEAQEKSAG